MSNRLPEIGEKNHRGESAVWRTTLAELSKTISYSTSFLTEVFRFQKPVKSKHASWDSVNLARRFATPEYSTQTSWIDALRNDARHFAKEFGLQEAVTNEISYTISRTNAFELGDGYTEPMSVLLSNFIHLLAKNNKSFSRATVEQLTMNALFSQLRLSVTQAEDNGGLKALENTGYLLTSPPDDAAAGYEGSTSKRMGRWTEQEQHHSFVFLLEIKSVTTDTFVVEARQYRLWPNMQQLLDLHTELGRPIRTPSSSITSQLFANIIPVSLEQLRLLHQVDDFGPPDPTETEFQAAVRKVLYKGSAAHHLSFRNRPQVPEDEFWQYLGISPNAEDCYFEQPTLFTDFYLERALPLFERATKLLQNKQDSNSEFADIISELDLVFTWYKTAFGRWIIMHNNNPLFSETAQWSTLDHLLAARNKVLLSIQTLLSGSILQPDSQEDKLAVPSLHEAFELHLKATKGAKLSHSELRILNASLGILGVVNSGLQCGLGSVITVPVQLAMRSMLAEPLTIVAGGISAISSHEIHTFLSQLDKLDYVELDLRAQGATSVYMVPKSYLAEPGCTVDTNSGRVLGPCNLYLDDPKEKLAYAMDKQQFAELKQLLLNEAARTELESIPSLLESQLHEPLSEKVLHALCILKKYLFKHVVSIAEWLAGDYIVDATTKLVWLWELKEKLRYAPNPFELLSSQVEELLNHSPELLRELNNTPPQPARMAV